MRSSQFLLLSDELVIGNSPAFLNFFSAREIRSDPVGIPAAMNFA